MLGAGLSAVNTVTSPPIATATNGIHQVRAGPATGSGRSPARGTLILRLALDIVGEQAVGWPNMGIVALTPEG